MGRGGGSEEEETMKTRAQSIKWIVATAVLAVNLAVGARL